MFSIPETFDAPPEAEKMREKHDPDRELFDGIYQTMTFPINPNNPLFAELEAIDRLLDETPEILALVAADLNQGAGDGPGRPCEISAEQALRSALLMQLRSLAYRQLAAEIDAHPLYRKFTRFYGKKIPHFGSLNEVIKKISGPTMQRVNEAIVRLGIKKKVENGRALRHDATVTETHIAWPIDARLLVDSVRVLSRQLERLRQAVPQICFAYHDHTRRAKKRAYQIVLGKGKNIEARRRNLYRDLLEVQQVVVGYARAAVAAEPAAACDIEALAALSELQRLLPLAERVYDQAYRRVVLGEAVPAEEKLVSVFETHTDIICRGKAGAKVEFGHKIDFATGRSGMVTYYEVLEGNPGDNEVLPRALDEHIRIFGRAPEKLATDRRYFSADNEAQALAKGVKQVALPKPGRLSAAREQLQRQPWFRRLLRWRAGIEGNLSTLLRSFGLRRCLWKGWESFKAYVGLSVLAYNLRLLAGHLSRV